MGKRSVKAPKRMSLGVAMSLKESERLLPLLIAGVWVALRPTDGRTFLDNVLVVERPWRLERRSRSGVHLASLGGEIEFFPWRGIAWMRVVPFDQVELFVFRNFCHKVWPFPGTQEIFNLRPTYSLSQLQILSSMCGTRAVKSFFLLAGPESFDDTDKEKIQEALKVFFFPEGMKHVTEGWFRILLGDVADRANNRVVREAAIQLLHGTGKKE